MGSDSLMFDSRRNEQRCIIAGKPIFRGALGRARDTESTLVADGNAPNNRLTMYVVVTRASIALWRTARTFYSECYCSERRLSHRVSRHYGIRCTLVTTLDAGKKMEQLYIQNQNSLG